MRTHRPRGDRRTVTVTIPFADDTASVPEIWRETSRRFPNLSYLSCARTPVSNVATSTRHHHGGEMSLSFLIVGILARAEPTPPLSIRDLGHRAAGQTGDVDDREAEAAGNEPSDR